MTTMTRTSKVVTTKIDKDVIIKNLVEQLATQRLNGAHGNGSGLHIRIN